MTVSDIVTIIVALGAISGLIIFFFSRSINNKSISANISKTNKESEQIEQEIESKYADQVRKWLDDIQEIKEKHEAALAKKDDAIVELHKQYALSLSDVTEQSLRFDRLNRATRRILANMDVPYWECDAKGDLIYVNGAWLKLFGITSQEALGQGWISSIPEDERDSIILVWNGRVVDQSEVTLEFNILNPATKKLIRVRTLYAFIFGSDNAIFKIIGVTLPIQAEEALQNK